MTDAHPLSPRHAGHDPEHGPEHGPVHGLARDLPRLMDRRRLLTILGGLGLGATALPAAAATCTVALPWETAGPFPADGTNARAGQTVNALAQQGILRRDITASFGAFTGQAEGVPLELEMHLADARGCTPLAGHAIYIWHCDGAGRYSLYNTPEANWLRGLGVADAQGRVRFTTIIPGCYPRRWPHIHFELFDSPEAAITGRASRLTAQLAFPEAEVTEVYQTQAARYPGALRNLAGIPLARDSIFRNNSPAQLAQQTLAMRGGAEMGYAATVTIPVDLSAGR
ncbi:hypothetical protein [Pseudooceanicola sp. 200-1SW]|uniref:dioxygenase family protein n=1 Tax=Pseudooceanicola sp. 200-1SW TaxID=3425949 RepID=UPI003D7FC531